MNTAPVNYFAAARKLRQIAIPAVKPSHATPIDAAATTAKPSIVRISAISNVTAAFADAPVKASVNTTAPRFKSV